MDDVKMGIDRKTYRLKEETLARKRNQEYRKQLFWNDITNYYKTWDVQATKHNLWASQPPTPSRKEEKDGNAGQQHLEQRRNRLSRLLNDEFKCYEEELEMVLRLKNNQTTTTSSNSSSCSNSSSSSSSSRRRRRRWRRIETETTPDETADGDGCCVDRCDGRLSRISTCSRSLEERRSQESMKQCWNEQMKEKQMRKEFERKLALKLEEENARKRLLEQEATERVIRQRKEETMQLQIYLQSQIDEVKKRDELTQQLKQRERQDIQLKRELEEMAVERNLIEKQRRSKELFSFLRHQYQTQLKRKTKLIQEELKEDEHFVEQLTRRLEEEELKTSWIREQARKEIDRANAVLREYSRLEKQREKEMDFLFFEEAKKLWHKQETRWIAEQQARNDLMRDVLITIQKQIKDKLERNADQHSKLIEEKELLLKNIQVANTRLNEANHETREKQQKYKRDLDTQVLRNFTPIRRSHTNTVTVALLVSHSTSCIYIQR